MNPPNPTRCCEWGLSFADGRRCEYHITPEDRELLAELRHRGRAVGIVAERWPYGPNVDVQSRARMLAWAETYEVRLANPRHKCLRWLRKGRCSGVLKYDICREDRNERRWLDHVTCWSKNGKPAVLVSQPYDLSDEDRTYLAELGTDPSLEVEISPNAWYGHGTTFIGIWRAEAFLDLADAAEVIAEAREDLADQELLIRG